VGFPKAAIRMGMPGIEHYVAVPRLDGQAHRLIGGKDRVMMHRGAAVLAGRLEEDERKSLLLRRWERVPGEGMKADDGDHAFAETGAAHVDGVPPIVAIREALHLGRVAAVGGSLDHRVYARQID